jgi:Uma2 family endonuclease
MAIDILTLDQPQITIPDSAWTLDGFRDWVASDECPERGRFAFFDNKLVFDMSPEHGDLHVKIKYEIALAIELLNRKLDLGTFYGDGMSLTNEEANISNEPDGMFILWETLEKENAKIVKRKGSPTEMEEVVGSPDLVLEVVSPSSVKKDTQILREAYYKAGIREYWLVDARGEEIDFQILVRGTDGYQSVEAASGMKASEVLPASFRLTRERDRSGLWNYTLHVDQR